MYDTILKQNHIIANHRIEEERRQTGVYSSIIEITLRI
jgi:hypothetical protein